MKAFLSIPNSDGVLTYIPVELRRYTRLLHPKLVALVMVLREDGRPNAMPASWVMPASVEPPLLVVAVSPRRYTYDLIQRRPEFTVNPVPLKMR
ncbi:MAG: flavin reductase, partial [Desulfurococcaceae archaeon]